MHGTFRVPTDINERTYEAVRLAAVRKYIDAMQKQGWELWPDSGIEITPGVYPAQDLATGLPLLGQRELVISAAFRKRHPKPLRLLIPPSYSEQELMRA